MKRFLMLGFAVLALALPAAAQMTFNNDDDGVLPKAPPRTFEATINGYMLSPVPGMPGLAIGIVTLATADYGWTPYVVGAFFVQNNLPSGLVGTVPINIPVPEGVVTGWMVQMPGEPDWKFLLRVAQVTQFVKDLHGV